ncbi:alkaline phosphatase [Chitinimonas sp. BJYL2]|uniref:alkaline phosphatase D family protein n=1 Tax=Chitinimonas sp. BJYL2 TaxID=2976696 RepID=UPI0022B4B416|nr:alkaline phosphatase D family protein [Chitinimonas sp. BJYL2]
MLTAQAVELIAGPMAGPPTMRGVTLWLQADAEARASIEYWPEASPNARRRSAAMALKADEQFVGKVTLFGLEPGRRYGYRVLLNDKPASKATFAFATQVLWQWRKDAPDFTLQAGSCNFGNEPGYDRPGKPYGDRHLSIFSTMAAQKPDLTLWLGDNLYFREVDYSSPEGMAYRWQRDRSQGYLQPALQVGAHAAIWDDHDYGPNDANKSFVFKGEALKLQQRYWANPAYGLPETPGAFTTFSFNDVDFFLLDNRTYRDDPRMPPSPDKAMFGPSQMAWLKNALLQSTAPFKIIAGGSQMLNKGERGDSWADYPAERDDFLRFLQDTRVDGVMFMSGDVHRSELIRKTREGMYPLHDLTCSALTSGVYRDEKLLERPDLVPGTLVMGERNFCQLRFEGGKANRQAVVRVLNDLGEVKFEHVITAQSLKAPKAK